MLDTINVMSHAMLCAESCTCDYYQCDIICQCFLEAYVQVLGLSEQQSEQPVSKADGF